MVSLLLPKEFWLFSFSQQAEIALHSSVGREGKAGGWGFQSLRVAGEGDSASAAHLLFQSPGLERDP